MIVSLIVAQLLCYAVIGFIVHKHAESMRDLADKIASTYLEKLEKEMEERRMPDEEAVDPEEIAELSEQELFSFHFGKKDNSTNDEQGDYE